MTRHRVGLWLVGAFGGVGTTITLGLAAMARGLADRTGLVTELATVSRPASSRARRFRDRRPRHPPHFVRRVGRGVPPQFGSLRGRLDHRLSRRAGGGHRRVSVPERTSARAERSPSWDTGATAKPAAHGPPGRGPHRRRHGRVRQRRVGRPLIVLNVASTEPPFALGEVHHRWDTLSAALPTAVPSCFPPARSTHWPLSSVRLYLHQLHAQPGRLAPRPGLSWPAPPARSMPARTAKPARP